MFSVITEGYKPVLDMVPGAYRGKNKKVGGNIINSDKRQLRNYWRMEESWRMFWLFGHYK